MDIKHIRTAEVLGKVLVVLEMVGTPTLTAVSPFSRVFVGSGILVPALMERDVIDLMYA